MNPPSSSQRPQIAAADTACSVTQPACASRPPLTGDTSEAAALIERWHSLHPRSANPDPAQWAAAYAALDNPGAVARLLDALRAAGAGEQAAALLARDPASASRTRLGAVEPPA